jgi:hypothetical protein
VPCYHDTGMPAAYTWEPQALRESRSPGKEGDERLRWGSQPAICPGKPVPLPDYSADCAVKPASSPIPIVLDVGPLMLMYWTRQKLTGASGQLVPTLYGILLSLWGETSITD